jgi:hypothetical protein
MIKKLMFILLVAVLFAAGAVVSMADDDLASVKNLADEKTGWSGIPVTNNSGAAMYIDEFSHQAVIDKYSEVIFDRQSQAGGIYFKEDKTKLVKDEESSNIQDYKLTATLLDSVKLTDGDSIVIMVFVETDDNYTLLTVPKHLYTPWLRWYKFRLPHTGKDKPNNVRMVAFQKSQWKSLELGVNLEITDRTEIIENENPDFDFKGSLKNSRETIKQVEIVLQ